MVDKRRILTALLVLPLAMSGCRNSKAHTPEELDSTIRRELPAGTSRAAVISFLKQHNISRTDSVSISYYKGPRRVWGLMTVGGKHNITVTDVTFTFEFDQYDKLVSYTMNKRLVGP